MVAHFIDTRSLLELCEETERTTGEWVGMQCWEQGVIYLTGARSRAVVAADADEDRGEQ